MTGCIYCKSEKVNKKGYLKTKRGKTQRYQCKSCKKYFTKRNKSVNYRHRKQHLREMITKLYCERMSLRGIARTLGLDRKTVVRYFRENTEQAREANKARIKKKGLVTSYAQFDQLETYEHTKRRPVGVQLSIRHKTGEIISAKVGYIPVRGLTVSKRYLQWWNERVRADDDSHLKAMLKDTKKALNPTGSTLTCDWDRGQINTLERNCKEPWIAIQPSKQEHKKINRLFRRMRHDISRLGRKTLSTTKSLAELQNHLDLYTDYHNVKQAA